MSISLLLTLVLHLHVLRESGLEAHITHPFLVFSSLITRPIYNLAHTQPNADAGSASAHGSACSLSLSLSLSLKKDAGYKVINELLDIVFTLW